ncbi:MAG: hypothetical protein EPN61_06155 [Burkholderiaceae bacterium]|nr:MAG: hypothetical protein EPN61_06155 [Burkholderiaceae bacterium]
MLLVSKILAGAVELARGPATRSTRTALTVTALLALSACGQRGDLYLPTGPAAAQRATLLQTLRFGQTAPVPASAASAASAPVPAVSSPRTTP